MKVYKVEVTHKLGMWITVYGPVRNRTLAEQALLQLKNQVLNNRVRITEETKDNKNDS